MVTKLKGIPAKLASNKLKTVIIVMSILFFAAAIFASAANAYNVEIVLGNETINVMTMRTDPKDILDQAGITTGVNDIVDTSEFIEKQDSKISVYKYCNVTLIDNGKKSEISGRYNVGNILLSNGIFLSDGDVINYKESDPLTDGMVITLTRSFPVVIIADGKSITVNMTSGTVSDALDKAVLTVDDDDIISKSLSTAVTENMVIKITRVEYKQRSEEKAIAYKTISNKTSTLSVGQSKTTQKGVNGKKAVTYSDKYVDGKLTESTLTSTQILKAAVNKIQLVGTKQSVRNTLQGVKLASGIRTISNLTPPSSLKLTKNNTPSEYKKRLVGTASAYAVKGGTSTGKTAQPGYIAVNPRQIPYHTKMWIVSSDGNYVYGYASAEDTGGFTAWTGSRSTICDLYFNTDSECNRFGRRSVDIYIL